jgi:hypothetical protein
MAYLVTGTSRKASRLCGVPEDTIRDWKTRSDWWPEVMAQCRIAKAEELDATFSDILDKTTGAILDRIDGGDYVRDSKTGEVSRLPLGGKELATIAGIIFDKRQLLRGDATSRTVSISTGDVLNELQNTFRGMAEKIQGRTINATVERVIENDEEDQ